MSSPPVFTCCYFIKMNYSPDCVYYVSHIFDILIFFSPFGNAGGLDIINGKGVGKGNAGWVSLIWFISSLFFLCMCVFAIIQIFTKNSSAGSRQATYIKGRLLAIVGLVALGLILFGLNILYALTNNYAISKGVEWGLNVFISYLISAMVLHGYHPNFGGGDAKNPLAALAQ